MTIHRFSFTLMALLFGTCLLSLQSSAQNSKRTAATRGSESSASASQIPVSQLVQPEELVKTLRSAKSPKPLILQVGFRVLYVQAHIPGSEYVAAASTPEGIQQLQTRVQKLPRTAAIVLYCGCCPWSHCPNVEPAYEQLRRMGFKDVKVLYIANDFGTDWVGKGYPVASGQ